MKTNLHRHRRGFTLVELLTVIAIIGILAAMLLPVLSIVKQKAYVARAKTEESALVTAITSYDTDYGRFPLTTNELAAAYATGQSDFTTGLIQYPQPGQSLSWPAGSGGNRSYDTNNIVISILMDLTSFPDGDPTPNANHAYNPKQTKYLNAKPSGYNPANGDLNPPGGVDNWGIYRDPWGNPYIITMNTSYSMDGSGAAQGQGTSDLLYSMQSVSQNPPLPATYTQAGFNGLANPNASPTGSQFNDYLFHGKVMVWSAGPNGKIDNGPATGPSAGFNKDNVLSWQ